MFDQYSYKKKCLALGVIFVMLAGASYKRSFKGMIEVVGENKKLERESEEYNEKSKGFDAMLQEIAILDRAIGKEGVTKEEVQQNIVNFIGSSHPGVSISDLQPIHLYSDDSYRIISNQLDLTGSADHLLKASYGFEKEFGLSRVVSTNFYTSKNNKSEVLHLKIIFQNYENNK